MKKEKIFYIKTFKIFKSKLLITYSIIFHLTLTTKSDVQMNAIKFKIIITRRGTLVFGISAIIGPVIANSLDINVQTAKLVPKKSLSNKS